MLDALSADALIDDGAGATLRVSLPWIRSLPIAAVSDVEVQIDGEPAQGIRAALDARVIPVEELALEPGWWFVQDRLALQLDRRLDAGTHAVRLAFRLAIPYLQVGPDGPLTLPFLFERELVAVAPGSTAGVARDVA